MNRLARFTRSLRRLFNRTAAAPVPQTAAEVLRSDRQRRTTVRELNPLKVACRANGLSNDQRLYVFEQYKALAPVVGVGEARRMCCDIASKYGAAQRRANATTPPFATA